jgi:hypothetical protein
LLWKNWKIIGARWGRHDLSSYIRNFTRPGLRSSAGRGVLYDPYLVVEASARQTV